MNITLHKQIFDLLQESGTRGMTLSVCFFSFRHIYEQLYQQMSGHLSRPLQFRQTDNRTTSCKGRQDHSAILPQRSWYH